jgi:hypothetical protein
MPVFFSARLCRSAKLISIGEGRVHARKWGDEELYENLVFHSGRCAVHSFFCGGQAELQEDPHKLSDE